MCRVYLMLTIFWGGPAVAQGCGDYGNGIENKKRIEMLRQLGPAGLVIAVAEYDSLKRSEKEASPAKLRKFQHLVDQVAGQRHATVSRLYWYTNLEAAKRQAVETGKPILSLRMLGKLTDEFSCANSRFFRTSLYANEAISKKLRENFVLHWQSVRPVPKVTIDFGDGRKLERTVTGNSAHYVLDTTGRPLDVLPGLYSPSEFQAWLDRCGTLFESLHGTKEKSGFEQALVGYHQSRYQAVMQQWHRDLHAARVDQQVLAAETKLAEQFPTAGKAAQMAVTKSKAERPILNLVFRDSAEIEKSMDDDAWQKIAALHRGETHLDRASHELIRREHPAAQLAGARAATKRAVEDPVLRLVRQFEDSISLDTVRNEYLLHSTIHQWFAAGTAPADYDALNERVYTELFLTPSSDPWLGLAPPESYTALEGEGLSVSK